MRSVSFVDSERQKEQRKLDYGGDYVPCQGRYIWKYTGRKKAGGRGYKIGRIGGILGIPAGVLLISFVCAGFMIIAEQKGLKREFMELGSLGMVLLITVIAVGSALKVGRRTLSRAFAFARDDEGRMYVFRYTAGFLTTKLDKPLNYHGILNTFQSEARLAKLIEEIDRRNIIEQVMDSGEIYPFGNEIVSVEKIVRRKNSVIIYCRLKTQEREYAERILLDKSYIHLEELLESMKRIWHI